MPLSDHPPVSEEDLQPVSGLVETNRNFTIRDLARETELAPSIVFHILKNRLWMLKIAEIATILCCLYLVAALWAQRISLLMAYHFEWWSLEDILRTKTETPVKQVASSRIISKVKSSAESHQCESYGYSRLRLGWFTLKHAVVPRQDVNG